MKWLNRITEAVSRPSHKKRELLEENEKARQAALKAIESASEEHMKELTKLVLQREGGANAAG